jgi:AraC-like DNA-binding protein
MINVQPYLLGRYINNRLGKNFMTYINELRIQEVKSMFANPEFDDRTILEISLQSDSGQNRLLTVSLKINRCNSS